MHALNVHESMSFSNVLIVGRRKLFGELSTVGLLGRLLVLTKSKLKLSW